MRLQLGSREGAAAGRATGLKLLRMLAANGPGSRQGPRAWLHTLCSVHVLTYQSHPWRILATLVGLQGRGPGGEQIRAGGDPVCRARHPCAAADRTWPVRGHPIIITLRLPRRTGEEAR